MKHINLGTLHRLSGHVHFESQMAKTGHFDLDELVDKSVRSCDHCKLVTEIFEEGFLLGYEEAAFGYFWGT